MGAAEHEPETGQEDTARLQKMRPGYLLPEI